jgi:mannose/fructose/N-acetylgalactosamine-specific phosphotransferase system component IIC
MPPQLYLALIAAALVNLDRQCLGQIALSRPLATGFLVGLILNQTPAGLMLGLWTELIWLARPPLGGYIPPNGGLAVSTALLSLFAARLLHPALTPGWPLIALTFAAVVPLAYFATGVEKLVRALADKLTDRLKKTINKGQRPVWTLWPGAIVLSATLALGLVFLAAGSLILTFGLDGAINHLPEPAWTILGKGAPFIPIIGLVGMLENLKPINVVIYLITVIVTLVLMSQTAG